MPVRTLEQRWRIGMSHGWNDDDAKALGQSMESTAWRSRHSRKLSRHSASVALEDDLVDFNSPFPRILQYKKFKKEGKH